MKRNVFLVVFSTSVDGNIHTANGWLYADGEKPTHVEVKEWQNDMAERYLRANLPGTSPTILNLIPLAPL